MTTQQKAIVGCDADVERLEQAERRAKASRTAPQASMRGKQRSLFSTSGLPGQMNLFADVAVPDELIAKAKG